MIQAYYPYLSGDNLELAYVKMYNKFMEAVSCLLPNITLISHQQFPFFVRLTFSDVLSYNMTKD